MSNKTRLIRTSLAVVCIFIATIPCIGSATVVTKEKVVLCNPANDKFKYFLKYDPNPRHQYILATKGIRGAGSEELVTFLHGNDVLKYEIVGVIARCLPITPENPWKYMFQVTFDPEPLSVLVCKKGEGLYVGMESPRNLNPNAVRYYGDLTRLEDEDEIHDLSDLVHSTVPMAIGVANPVDPGHLTDGLHISIPPIMVGGSGLGGSPTK